MLLFFSIKGHKGNITWIKIPLLPAFVNKKIHCASHSNSNFPCDLEFSII